MVIAQTGYGIQVSVTVHIGSDNIRCSLVIINAKQVIRELPVTVVLKPTNVSGGN